MEVGTGMVMEVGIERWRKSHCTACTTLDYICICDS